jgi:tRNA nucleotidyltransferase (CCA-adding enzyme)
MLNFSQIFGFPIYLVGGAVRDHLLGIEVADIDIASAVHPRDFKQHCKRLKIKSFDTGIEHGTITIIIDGVMYEHTTFREDVSTDGRNATVQFSKTIEEDLSRRDFTINAIADLDGDLIDPFGGQEDLKNRLLRTVGNARDRFSEDYLRIIRAARFGSRLSMTIDTDLLEAARELGHQIPHFVSIERITDEFKKARLHGDAFLKVLKEMNLLEIILPYSAKLDQHQLHDWFIEVGRAGKLDMESYFTALFLPCGSKQEIEKQCRLFKLSNALSKCIIQISSHFTTFRDQPVALEDNIQIVRHCGDNYSRVLDFYQLVINDELSTPAIDQAKAELGTIQTALKTPFVRGGELNQLGVKPSPIFKELLDLALLRQIEGMSKEAILEELRKSLP